MSERARAAVRTFAGSAVGLGILGALALATGQPWLFPSLGPTVMLHVERPQDPSSAPRNTLIGHAVALLAGYGLLAATGLADTPSVLQVGVSTERIIAAAGSVAVTALVLILLDANHAPAGATTLLVSLGLLRTPTQLLVVAAAVALLTMLDWLFNRATGRPMPAWRSRTGGDRDD
ncbi:HPP family protein [Micromonospora sp. NPDC049559]|uniref:HPP family protein n=1 Tax=Micromonospora sp. NPDC049559 TaxID=3155923 RepID=UPI00342FE932